MKIKRRTNRPVSQRQALKNANAGIPESAVSLIRSIPERLLDESFSSTYLKDAFLSKFNSETEGVPADERRSNAILKWRATEEGNRQFSDRFAALDPGYNILPRISLNSFLKFARRLVAQVLGELSNDIVVGNFSGGASTSRGRLVSQKANKFSGMADLTESAYAFIDVIHHEAPLLKQYGTFYSLREVEGAVLFTVPKKSDIDRCACKEPDVNMFLQKGVGNHIRRRLLRFGQNLNDQSVNRAFARQGSITGELATIDLSSASDTICSVVVEALLPSDWFCYLNCIRSQQVIVDGETVRTSMFSSMGNGFTFELESLIFWALMKTTAYFGGYGGSISVYGDDIIVPISGYDDFLWVLKSFGFLPNESKSFGSGPFRESCGGHYHLGEDVTPFYLRREPKLLTDLIRVANQVRKWAFASPGRSIEKPALFQLWRELAAYVPHRLFGGHDYDLDTVLVSPPVGGSGSLMRVNKSLTVCELGRYLSWHCDAWNRTQDPQMGTFPPVSTSAFCRFKRTTGAFGKLDEFFLEELIATDPE